jgi:hypothetical protein
MDRKEREGTAFPDLSGYSRAQRNVPIWGSQRTAQRHKKDEALEDEDNSPSRTTLMVQTKTGYTVVAVPGYC